MNVGLFCYFNSSFKSYKLKTFHKIQLTWHLDNIEPFEFVVMNPVAAMDEKNFEPLDIPEWDLESTHDHRPDAKIKLLNCM